MDDSKMPKLPEMRDYTQEEYEADLRKELAEKGLYQAVHDALDEIHHTVVCAGNLYGTVASVQESMVKVLDFIRLEAESRNDDKEKR